MGRVLASLLWKEGCEQRWKLAFGCVILTGLMAVGLRVRILPDREVLYLVLFVGALLLPVLIPKFSRR